MKTHILLSLLVIVIATITSCKNEEEKQAEGVRDYYLNEYFILIDRQETVSMQESTPVTIWS